MTSKQGDFFTTEPVRREAREGAPAPRSAPVTRRAPSAPRAAPQVLSVSELTAQVKDALEPSFLRVLVRGEISNFRGANSAGHLYFALKDKRASLDVKVWATTARGLRFALKEGMAVIVEGSLNVYEPHGRYSLIVNRIEPEGVGARALAFEQLKAKLLKGGLLGEARCRSFRRGWAW